MHNARIPQPPEGATTTRDAAAAPPLLLLLLLLLLRRRPRLQRALHGSEILNLLTTSSRINKNIFIIFY